MTKASKWGVAFVVGALGLVGGLCVVGAPQDNSVGPFKAEKPTKQSHIGSEKCQRCHAAIADQWSRSHHGLAMQEASTATVLGDFGSVGFAYAGVESRFFERDGGYVVRTDGPDGVLADYTVKFTFGVAPLQQYLVETEPGRLHALPFAWDARDAASGGKRWFHLRPHERVTSSDALHWTSPQYNWNSACADCHATAVNKNYDRKSRSYATTFEEATVGCEACHGPGSRHVEMAEAEAFDETKGLTREFSSPSARIWSFVADRDIAVLSAETGATDEVVSCAPCHSRRADFGFDGALFHDRYRLSLLDRGLYFPDGQILDEVFVLGSFLQSKMHAAGVVCTDCHDVHRAGLIAQGNALCTRCHKADVFDGERHHMHPSKSAGAECTACHMPERTYMGVDARADHRFGLPRPDLSDELGTPNACTSCHDDRSAQWAARQIRQHFGETRPAHFGKALAEARREVPNATEDLAALAASETTPAIVRATAIVELGELSPPGLGALLRAYAGNADPLIRRAVAQAAGALGPSERADVLVPMLSDDVRTVRLQVVAGLFGLDHKDWEDADRVQFQRGRSEYKRSWEFVSDRGEGLAALAHLAAAEGEPSTAEALLREAIAIDPTFTPAYVNLSDLYRVLGREQEAVTLLRDGVLRAADTASMQHALGLSLVRVGQHREAMQSLETAHRLAPDNARYGYVYAVALFDQGEQPAALRQLERLHAAHESNREVLSALVGYHRKLGHHEAAARYERTLRELGAR